MREKVISGTACAILSLATRLAWTQDLPKPMPRSIVWRMLRTGALDGLALRDTSGIDEKWFERARRLLGRIGDVYDGIEAYQKDGYHLVMPGEALWPDSLRMLGEEAPLFLFVNGSENCMNMPRIAVAGSRRILLETQKAAVRTGGMIVAEENALVTGGAAGVDSAALRGAADAGGHAVIVPAVPAMRLFESSVLRSAHEHGRAAILCDTLPDEPFSAAKALSRNHTIYALGKASLVVAAREGKGGSWRGATSCLQGGWSPVYVWNGENADTMGNRALERLGAQTYTLEQPLHQQLKASPEQASTLDRA